MNNWHSQTFDDEDWKKLNEVKDILGCTRSLVLRLALRDLYKKVKREEKKNER